MYSIENTIHRKHQHTKNPIATGFRRAKGKLMAAKFLEKPEIQAGVAGAKIQAVPGRAKTYKVTYTSTSADGKRRTLSRTVAGLALARQTAKELAEQAAAAPIATSKRGGGLTLGAAVARYLNAGKRSWTPKTYQTKADRLQRRLVDFFGSATPCADITPLAMQALQDRLLDTLAPTTAKGALLTITAFFSQLVSWQAITSNPAKGLTPIRGAKAKQKAIWQPAEVEQALDADSCPLSVRLALVTGIRPEELQALTWDSVDLVAGTVAISRAAYYDTARKVWAVRDGVKTSTSRRTVALDRRTVALLQAELDRQGTGASFVVPAKRLGGVTPTNTLRKQLDDFAAAAGLPKIPLYALRHSSITYLLDQGIPLKAVAARAGHSSTATTLAHYAAATDSAAAAAAQVFNR